MRCFIVLFLPMGKNLSLGERKFQTKNAAEAAAFFAY